MHQLTVDQPVLWLSSKQAAKSGQKHLTAALSQGHCSSIHQLPPTLPSKQTSVSSTAVEARGKNFIIRWAVYYTEWTPWWDHQFIQRYCWALTLQRYLFFSNRFTAHANYHQNSSNGRYLGPSDEYTQTALTSRLIWRQNLFELSRCVTFQLNYMLKCHQSRKLIWATTDDVKS